MKTAIVTDSNCGISKEEAADLNIFIIPMPVYIQNDFYYEGIDLHPESFLMHLKDQKEVHTSQPSPADLLAMWEKVFSSGFDELVYIPTGIPQFNFMNIKASNDTVIRQAFFNQYSFI